MNIGIFTGLSNRKIQSSDPIDESTLLEGFESWSMGLPDTLGFALGSGLVTQSTSHVTEGTYSCRMQDDMEGNPALELDGVDLSQYTTLYLDYFSVTVPEGSDGVHLYAQSGDGSDAVFALGATIGSSDTIELDISTLTDPSNAYLEINCNASGVWDAFIDNLRAS